MCFKDFSDHNAYAKRLNKPKTKYCCIYDLTNHFPSSTRSSAYWLFVDASGSGHHKKEEHLSFGGDSNFVVGVCKCLVVVIHSNEKIEASNCVSTAQRDK